MPATRLNVNPASVPALEERHLMLAHTTSFLKLIEGTIEDASAAVPRRPLLPDA